MRMSQMSGEFAAAEEGDVKQNFGIYRALLMFVTSETLSLYYELQKIFFGFLVDTPVCDWL